MPCTGLGYICIYYWICPFSLGIVCPLTSRILRQFPLLAPDNVALFSVISNEISLYDMSINLTICTLRAHVRMFRKKMFLYFNSSLLYLLSLRFEKENASIYIFTHGHYQMCRRKTLPNTSSEKDIDHSRDNVKQN